jgi:hypothetical protein
MKIHSAHLRFGLQFGLCFAAFLPLPSHAGVEVPYWLYPEWIAAKVMDFHTRNSERFEQAQVVAQAKNSANAAAPAALPTTNAATNSTTNPTTSTNDPSIRKTNLAPVETATAKINEKHLSKEELMELRKQLRQKP